jgi:hypothetical protein
VFPTAAKAAGVAAAVALLLFYLPTAWGGFVVHGAFGWQMASDGTLVAIRPGQGAARAGLRLGDRIVLRSGRANRIAAVMDLDRPGTAIDVHVQSGPDQGRAFRAVAVAERASAVDAWLQVGAYLVTAIAIVVAAVFLVARPGPMSWWFFAYAAGTIGGSELVYAYSWLPGSLRGTLTIGVFGLIGGVSSYPILPFALRFPFDRVDGARRVLYRASVALTVVAAIGFLWLYVRVANGTAVFDPVTMSWFQNLPIPLAIVTLVWTYLHVEASTRARLSWAILGMIVAFAAYAASSIAYIFSETLSNALELVTVVLPITLAYAALRYRLIDFSFALNRAIVYSATTTSVVVLVTVIDRLSGWFLSQFHLALALDAIATIGLGFFIGKIHRVLATLVDGTLFRKRLQAEQRLRRIAAAMPYATTPHNVDEMLVSEPCDAFALASCAVFRFERSTERYVRTASVGWDDAHAITLDVDDPLVLLLKNEGKTIQIDAVRSGHDGFPSGLFEPQLALPIRFRSDLTGAMLVGAHRNATALDPEEVALLGELAAAAGTAYGLAEAAITQRRVLELESRLARSEVPT